jgi:G:T/U-mismatch repair DNA glycosylase
MDKQNDIERHPFKPFIPDNAKLIMLGSFPPAPKRWKMHFFYPNFTNDMWRIFGIVFFNDKEHFINIEEKTYKLQDIIDFLNEKGIALYDTAEAIRRTKDTASDKDLEIVERTDVAAMLRTMYSCRNIITTGQKATDVITELMKTESPKVGGFSEFTFEDRTMRLYRMPSSSRAYPLNIEKKAAYYRKMFKDILG